MSKKLAHAGQAEILKSEGNNAYRKSQLASAIAAYSQAAKLAPEQPVYLSNLSAAQYEDGQYDACKGTIKDALELIGDREDSTSQGHKIKLLFRKAKVLLQLKDITAAKMAADELVVTDPNLKPAQALAAAIERFLAQPTDDDAQAAKRRVPTLPRYRYPRRPNMEYYVVGHDPANSLLAPQYNGDREGPSTPKRLRITAPKTRNEPFEFAGMFAGLGDGRHFYATLVDLAQQLRGRGGTGPLRLHLTAIEINPTVLARDLVVLFALEELSHVDISKHKTDPSALNLLVMLHYLYWGTVMPPSAHDTMMAMMQTVSDALEAAEVKGAPLDRAWMYMGAQSVKPVLEKLQWWLGEGKTALPFSQMLQKRSAKQKERRLAVVSDLSSPENQAHIAKIAADDGVSHAEAEKAFREKMLAYDDEDIDTVQNTPEGCLPEAECFKLYRILAPPEHASEPRELLPHFQFMRMDLNAMQDKGTRPLPPQEKSKKLLREHWRINCTFLTSHRTATGDLDMEHSPFIQIMKLFSSPQIEAITPKKPLSLYDYSAAFFSHAADAFRLARSASKDGLRLEIVLGDAFVVMDRVLYGTLQRRSDFPSSFDRIHLSNVPDYVGGDLSSFTSAFPLLKKHPTAYLTRNCLLNTGIWEGGFSGPHSISADSLLFSYAGLVLDEVPGAFGLKLEGKPVWMGDYYVWTALQSPAPRLPKAQLDRMLYRVFLKTVLPAKYSSFRQPYHPREVLNIHAFFRLIVTLVPSGYPKHSLQETLEAMMENRVVTDVRPHTVIPIPLSSRKKAQAGAPLTMGPFMAELEVACALWQPLLPFRICSPNLPALNNLVRYSVRIGNHSFPMDYMTMMNHFTQVLCVGTPQDLDTGVGKLRTQVVGAHVPRTSVQIITTFEWDNDTRVATFLLPRHRGTALIESGFEIAVVDCMFWRIASMVSSCSDMQEVGDADRWDRNIEVKPSKERKPPSVDEKGMVEDVMGGGMGGLGGLGGLEGLSDGGLESILGDFMSDLVRA